MKNNPIPRSYAEWVRTEGGLEHPTHIETLKKAEQVARIEWLKRECNGVIDILDLGCNWGYILNELNGKTGMDINPENIELAKKTFPKRHWMVGDITKDLGQFGRDSYAIVILAEVLEHLKWDDLPDIIDRTIWIARHKVLITLPSRPTSDCAFCFKHVWYPNLEKAIEFTGILMRQGMRVSILDDSYFFYFEVDKWND